MMATVVSAARPAVAVRSQAFAGLRPLPARSCKPMSFGAVRQSVRPARKAATVQASMVEVAQLAGEGGVIFGTAGVMFAITLVGLAVGFVLLRIESLAEEGKI